MSKSNTGDANVDKLKDDPRRAPKVIVMELTIYRLLIFVACTIFGAKHTIYSPYSEKG